MQKFKEAIFITGSGSGVGFACTKFLLQQGYFVFGAVLNSLEKEHVEKEFKENFLAIPLNITSTEECAQAYELVRSELKDMHLRALINVAGVIYNGPLMDVTKQQFEHILAVNTIGVHLISQALLPLLETTQGRNKIINISSQSGLRTLPFTGIYSASKFALEALSNAMRYEYSVFGIDVALIEPGQIQTPMADQIIRNIQVKPSHKIYDTPIQIFFKQTKLSFESGIPIQKIISTIYQALTSQSPKFRYQIHNDYFRDAILFRKFPIKLQDILIRKALRLKPISQQSVKE